ASASTNQGQSWSPLESLTSSTNGWEKTTQKITFSSPTNSLRLRFSATNLDSWAFQKAAIDALKINAYVCASHCPADFNHDGAQNVQDIFDFLSAFFSNEISADADHSGAVSVQDIFSFVGLWFQGC
ncbi:MAG TPA: GC-type dockerin domain-anchored protein, partial [Prosthecobacter sp.]|nr:GC-type dockerin domain-anchored protein [Prosthecobacter sp.]